MRRQKFLLTTVATLTLFALSAPARSDDINLKLASFPNGNHKYYHQLLEGALKASGHSVTISSLDNLPQPRIISYLDTGELTLHWMLQTKERDTKYTPIDHKLTQGLIGQRIMLIPKDDEGVYAKVKTLDDFKALGKVAGLGKGWFDVGVWTHNGLKVTEQPGEWRTLYTMIAEKSRGIDYFPRGATEIVAEAKENPKLAMEPRLVLVYPRDFRLYLSKPNAALKPTIEAALKKAEQSGMQKKLIDEFFGPSIASLGLEKRIRIDLQDPPN